MRSVDVAHYPPRSAKTGAAQLNVEVEGAPAPDLDRSGGISHSLKFRSGANVGSGEQGAVEEVVPLLGQEVMLPPGNRGLYARVTFGAGYPVGSGDTSGVTP